MDFRLAYSGSVSYHAGSIPTVDYSGAAKREPGTGDIDRARMENALSGPRKLIPAGMSRQELREYLLKDSSQVE